MKRSVCCSPVAGSGASPQAESMRTSEQRRPRLCLDRRGTSASVRIVSGIQSNLKGDRQSRRLVRAASSAPGCTRVVGAQLANATASSNEGTARPRARIVRSLCARRSAGCRVLRRRRAPALAVRRQARGESRSPSTPRDDRRPRDGRSRRDTHAQRRHRADRDNRDRAARRISPR